MHFYCFRAVKNYKNAFQFIYITKIKRFNSCLYFYYINNGINFLIITVDLNKVPFIIIERQNYIKLSKELQDKIKQIKGRERAILFESC